MTAEIAILNKTAVALAADSAITISAGQAREKMFDSGDKLFELSTKNSIGIMLYNSMDFMGIPLPILIKEYRDSCGDCADIETAGKKFLRYLLRKGREAPRKTKDAALLSYLTPLIVSIQENYNKKFLSAVFENGKNDGSKDPKEISRKLIDRILKAYEFALSRSDKAQFVSSNRPLTISQTDTAVIRTLVANSFQGFDDASKRRIVAICRIYLRKRVLSPSHTGVVIAGFGANDLFPTLVAYEIEGIVCNQLKYQRNHLIDIDRRGVRAAVVPFAQKDMVDRFVYGLDENIQRDIRKFCAESIPGIADELFEQIEFEKDEDRKILVEQARSAERRFNERLRTDGFETIRSQSRREIEEMVEFMPKPELARMAEALINLTSIKRRVSRGMETVAGPVDVAVISRAEGFVWVQRKHYFPPELNSRYFERMRSKMVAP